MLTICAAKAQDERTTVPSPSLQTPKHKGRARARKGERSPDSAYLTDRCLVMLLTKRWQLSIETHEHLHAHK